VRVWGDLVFLGDLVFGGGIRCCQVLWVAHGTGHCGGAMASRLARPRLYLFPSTPETLLTPSRDTARALPNSQWVLLTRYLFGGFHRILGTANHSN